MISNISCQTCLFSFDSINYLLTHLDELSTCVLHQSANYDCSLCLFKCTGSDEFCRHLSRDHHIDQHQYELSNAAEGSSKGTYKCTYCEKVFRKPSDLVRHLRIHTNEKPFKCRECGRSFKLKSTLNGHEKTHRAVDEEEIFSCIFCSHNFLSFSALKLHMRIHTNETPFPCDYPECKQSFRTKKLMHTHFRNFHDVENSATVSHIGSLGAVDSTLPAPYPKPGVLNTIGGISRLQGHSLVTSQNTAFSQFHKPNDYNEEVVLNIASQPWTVIVIRVQVRSGSVAPKPTIGQIPPDIIVEPSRLVHLSQRNMVMSVPLRKTGLPANYTLWIDPRLVLNRLEPPSPMIAGPFQPQFPMPGHNRAFTVIVAPTAKHVVTDPPQPFSVLCTAETNSREIRGPVPSFLIECFLATSETSQYDVAHRQSCLPILSDQSCLPVLCNSDGVQYDEMYSNKNPTHQY